MGQEQLHSCLELYYFHHFARMLVVKGTNMRILLYNMCISQDLELFGF